MNTPDEAYDIYFDMALDDVKGSLMDETATAKRLNEIKTDDTILFRKSAIQGYKDGLESAYDVDGGPCCPDPGCNGNPCDFPGYASNH